MPSDQIRSHPLYADLLQPAAAGHPPTENEIDTVLDTLKVPLGRARRRIHDAVTQAAQLRRDGYHARARELAADVTAELVDELPEHRPPAEPLPTDPRALADRVARG